MAKSYIAPASLVMLPLLALAVLWSAQAHGADSPGRPAQASSHAPGPRASPPVVVDIDRVPGRVLTLDLTRSPNDIWDRIRRGFAMPDISGKRVVALQTSYLSRPAYLERMFKRGGRYLYYIVDELERRHLPTELALLPMVESSFNPLAYSRASASGLWQFIPSTGRDYKLTQNRWIDERRDLAASTAAALDYLADIYGRHGDWHLALASYNRGENAIGRAVERNRAAGRSTEFGALRLPTETRDYLPKLQALKNIVAQPELYGIELPYIPNEQFLTAIDAPVGIDLATAAGYAELPLEEFLAINPGFNRPAITTPGKTLMVPFDHAPRFSARLEEFARTDKGWRNHTLQRGEGLGEVARRHDIDLEDLLQINGLPAKSRPAPGYTLLVPTPGTDPSGALTASQLLPANARTAARAGVQVGSSHSKKVGKSKAKKKAQPKKSASTKKTGSPKKKRH